MEGRERKSKLRKYFNRRSLRGLHPGIGSSTSELRAQAWPARPKKADPDNGDPTPLLPSLSSIQLFSTQSRIRRHTDAAYRPQQCNNYASASSHHHQRYVSLDYDTRSLSGSTSHRSRYSEDVADRNLQRSRPDGYRPTTGRSMDVLDHNLPGYPRVVTEKGRYSEDVADRNLPIANKSKASTRSRDLAHIKIWGEQLEALQILEPDLESPSTSEVMSGRPSMLDRMVSSQGTTVMFVPPTETDALSSDSYFGGSDLELSPVSSAEDLFHRNTHRRMSSLDSVDYAERHKSGHQRMSSLDSVERVERRRQAHRRMSSLDKSLHEFLSVKPDSMKRLSSGVSSLVLADQPIVNNEPIEVMPLNVGDQSIMDRPPPIPRRATKHKVPEHIRNSVATTNANTSSAASLNESTGNQVIAHDLFVEPAQNGGHGADKRAETSKLADPTAAKGLAAAGVDLTNTVETHVHTKYAPAVTQEVIIPTQQEIRQEQITREIHQHDIFHRILPIRQTEFLPARHFIKGPDGSVTEIPASAAPGGSTTRLVVENVKQDEEDVPLTPRRKFTASTLEGFPEDYVDRVDDDGVKRSHTTWIHPPMLQEGGRETGQTEAFEFGAEETVEQPREQSSNDWHSVH